MKVMIVGGAGYIGSALTPKLLELGHKVSIVDLCWFGAHLPKKAEILRMDANDLTVEHFVGFDQVVFLGGLSNDPMAEYSPLRNFHENGATPSYIAWAAKRAGVKRIIYGGTCSVYGHTENALFDETSPTISHFPYGISKLIGEDGIMQLCSEDYSAICFRQGTVSGHSPRMRFDLIVNTMFKTAVSEGIIRVNNPTIWRPILSIRDAVTAYIRAIDAPQKVSGVFNVASGNFTVGEVAELVRDGVRSQLNIDPRLEVLKIPDKRNYRVDMQKAERVLGFKARWSVQEIVSELCRLRPKFGNFNDPTYYNIQTFKALNAA